MTFKVGVLEWELDAPAPTEVSYICRLCDCRGYAEKGALVRCWQCGDVKDLKVALGNSSTSQLFLPSSAFMYAHLVDDS